MSWLSYHIYPLETPDVFLVRALKPFLENNVWPIKGARAFYIRYTEEKGAHIRLRLRGTPDWMEASLQPAFETWIAERGRCEIVDYVSEPERFGGEAALNWAEEHFHISTRVALDCISKPTYTYGDTMFDSLKMLASAAFAAGLDHHQTSSYFERLFDQWLPVFFRPAENEDPERFFSDIKMEFAQSFKEQKDNLSSALADHWKMQQSGKFDKKRPEWLRWLRGNELIFNGLGDDLEKALPNLLHFHNNRMGINNQDEVYLNYLLSKAL